MGRFSNAWRALRGKSDSDGTSMLANFRPYGVPPKRGTRELLQAYRTSPWLRAVVGRMSSRVASVAWVLYDGKRVASDGTRQALVKHPLLDLLQRPNSVMTGRTAFEVTQTWLDLKGEAFWILWRNSQGRVVMAWPVPPHWIIETPSRDKPYFRASYGTWQENLPEADVIWFKDPDPENPYQRGTGTGEALGDEIDTDEYASKQVKAYFYNRMSPEIMVGIEGGASEDRLKELQARWDNEHRGFWNAAKTLFTGSKLTVTRLDTSFKDMALPDLRKWCRDAVINVYGVPPETFGIIENSNRSTIDAADYLIAKNVLVPRLDRLATELRPLVAEFGDALSLEYVSPVPEDREFVLKAATVRPSAFTDNEIRERAGLPHADGKDEFPAPLSSLLALPPAEAGKLGDPEWVRALRPVRVVNALPPRRKDLSAKDVENVLEALRPDRLTTETDPVFRRRMRSWARDALRALGASAQFDLLNPLITQRVEQIAGEKIADLVNTTTRDSLRATLAEGIDAGEDIRALKARVQDVFDEADSYRATLIARTEVVGASNWATNEAYQISGVVENKGWVATRDGRTRDTHREMDGQQVPVKGKFRSPSGATADYPGGFGDPAEDINCFPGSTTVQSPCGIDAVFRRNYSGDLVEVTTEDGERLAGTPNHPVLTQRGWVALSDLNETDHLVRCRVAKQGDSLGDDEDHKPPTFKEVANLAALRATAMRSVASGNQHFHGDGREGEVDVVAVDGHLGDRVQPPSLQHLQHLPLAAADALAAVLKAAGQIPPTIAGLLVPAKSPVGGGGEGGARLGAGATKSLDLSGAASSGQNASVHQPRANRGAGDPEGAREGKFALAGDIPADDLLDRQRDPDAAPLDAVSPRVDADLSQSPLKGAAGHAQGASDSGDRPPFRVELRRVVQKCVRQWSGQVFNLQNRLHWYIADGFVSHNCRCTQIAIIEDPKAEHPAVVKAEGLDLDAVWRAYDAALRPWEDEVEQGLRRGFREQRADVLAALERFA